MLYPAAEASPSGKGAERPALFLRRASTGRLWFNTSLIRSTRRQQQYRWAGWLLGQCFANRASVCLPLPELLFDKLLKGPTFQVPLFLPMPLHAFPESLASSCSSVVTAAVLMGGPGQYVATRASVCTTLPQLNAETPSKVWTQSRLHPCRTCWGGK